MSPCGLDLQVSQIIAVQLQEIKGVEHRDRAGTSTAQRASNFPPPWKAEKTPGGYVVRDANGQAMAYVGHALGRAIAPASHVAARGATRLRSARATPIAPIGKTSRRPTGCLIMS